MADIFISYSKSDHEQVRLLAAFLEAEGYSVWWDTNLLSGEKFRQVIMTELAQARAAIVVWTENSIHSDWVQSEAGRAQADRKLIPVKAKGLEHKDIPPPFDVMHTENLDARDKILAAVITQLAKPQVQAPAFRLFSKQVRYETLGWIGAIGTAFTLLNAVSPIMKLADWARYLFQNWEAVWLAVWSQVLAFLPFKIEKAIAAALTANLCVLVMALSSRRRVGTESAPRTKGTFLRQAPLVVLMSAIFIIATGPDPNVRPAGQVGTFLVYVFMVASFLLILLAAGGWLVRRGGVLRVLGGIGLMLAVSPIAAVVSLGSIVALAYVVNPDLAKKSVAGIDLSNWTTMSIAAGIIGVVFALLFFAPLVAAITADRSRLYLRIFRAFIIIGLFVALNLLSVYGPTLRDMFTAP